LVKEDDSISAFTGGEVNYVFSNTLMTTTAPVEFVKSPTSGSTVYSMQIWFP